MWKTLLGSRKVAVVLAALNLSLLAAAGQGARTLAAQEQPALDGDDPPEVSWVQLCICVWLRPGGACGDYEPLGCVMSDVKTCGAYCWP